MTGDVKAGHAFLKRKALSRLKFRNVGENRALDLNQIVIKEGELAGNDIFS